MKGAMTGRAHRTAALLGLLLATLYAPAQQPAKVPVVAMLASHAAVTDATHEQLREGLRAFGYEDGKNIRVEIVTAAGRVDRVQALADGLVSQNVDVIVCANETTIRSAEGDQQDPNRDDRVWLRPCSAGPG